MKGKGVFEFGGVTLEFQDTTNLFDYPIDYPDSLSKILGTKCPVDFESERDYIDLISGQLPSGDFVVIVDQNNNHSFRDDTPFTLQPIDWFSSRNSIPITFLVSDDADTVQRHSWIRIGLWKGAIIYGRDEHLSASFSIDDKHFDVGIIDQRNGSFTYGLEPQIALLTTERGKVDSIEVRDLIKMKEYLKLNGVYYKFDSISNAGNYVRLIKEKNFENKIGIQIGMLAPEFKFKSTSGNTMSTSLLHDKPLIIANSCGCGGDTKSSQAYVEIRETYQDDAYVLRLDSFSKNPSDEWTINMEDGYNKDSYYKFRQEYCSRICYIIGQNQRILDKFQITDWKKTLPKLLDN
ncbi:hypothetical protein [Chryseolinea lacunae]|uniref:Uncharacterized protein n=1 Tax=Chryseolinea lacunae TaxID=2801331 RepID=A0ABS1L192_9BACT|nr:hypothetical protein [Chryseolinea lacunae]MBL0745465.1 hypothetical protein [Chryseolinea lacunae]